MIEYHIIAVNQRTGECEDLDWTYSWNEALKWREEYKEEDEEAREQGIPVDNYEYEIEEVISEE